MSTNHQTSFFAHEVFEYFLPAQKVFCPAGKGGEAKIGQLVKEATNKNAKKNN
jgi:hypothetical protein